MYKFLSITLALLSSSALSAEYYGWAGSCSDIIYDFDFQNGKYTVYGNSKYIANGKEINNYFIKSDKITTNENGVFHLHDSTYNSKISLDLTDKNERIWGKSNQGNMLFNKCSNDEATKTIQHTKENT